MTLKKKSKPRYEDVVKAVGYWVVLDDLQKFFKEAEMPLVHQHLMLACQEIDRIWQDYNYEDIRRIK